MAKKSSGTTSYSILPQMKELERKLNKLAQAAQREALVASLEEGAEVVRSAANASAPGPHVELKADRQQTDTLAVVSVGPDKDHWYYQFAETGTQPHEIRPKTKLQLKALRFSGESGDVFAAYAKVSGAPARPFLRTALANNETRAMEVLYAALVRRLEAAR